MSENSNQQYSLVSTQEIYGILRKLALSQQEVSVRIGKITKRYFTQILDVNLESISFYLDYVSPEEGNKIINTGKRFQIDAQYQGARISFRVDKRMSYQSAKRLYRVEFPSEIIYLQRRTCFRVEQGVNDIKVILGTELSTNVGQGWLLDLSATGFKAEFSIEQETLLKAHKAFSDCKLVFANGQQLSLSLERHYLRYGSQRICLGLRITAIAPMQQRYLEQHIQQLQWQRKQLDADSQQTHFAGVNAVR